MLHIGRFLTGVSSVIGLPSVSIYISEIAQADIRGTLSALNTFTVMLGMLIVYSLGMVMTWRWLAEMGQSITLILVLFLVYTPETPRFLVMTGKYTEAETVLTWLRESNIECEKELKEISQSLNNSTPVSIEDPKRPDVFKPMVQVAVLVFFLELVGTMPLFFYGENIFESAGLEWSGGISQ